MFKAIIAFISWIIGFITGRKKAPAKKDGFETITVDKSKGDGIVILMLNRPKKKNAFNSLMYTEISETLNALSEDNTVKACIITGAGDFYSSGNDLANFSVLMHPLDMAKSARKTCDMFVSAFVNFKKPLVAAVNGPSIGIAATTLGLCDRIFACDRVYFKTPFAELGQSPEGCSSFVFPKIMGEGLAHSVLWESKVLTAQEAKQCGIVHEILPPGELEDAAIAYCRKLVGNVAVENVSALHWPIREGLVEKLREVNQAELDLLQKKWVSSECFLALATFLEKKNLKLAALMLRYVYYS